VKKGEIDLGNGYSATWYPWSPDRELNPQYDKIPDIEHCLLEVVCPHGNRGVLHPDTPEVRAVFRSGPFWTLISLDPLHLEPSVQFMNYKNDRHEPGCCHGFIRNGRWVKA
jgi:hypothetical protein